MEKLKTITAAAVLITAAAAALLYYGKDSSCEKPALVATTNVLSSVADEISGESIETQTLIPPGNCPGHFDMKVSSLRALGQTGALLAHGFEEYLPAVRNALQGELQIYKFPSEESWMTPEGQMELGRRMLEVLSEIFPEKRGLFEDNHRAFVEKTRAAAARLKAGSLGLEGINVICNGHLKGQLEYFGLRTVGSYGRKEDLNASRIRELLERGASQNALLVVDNLQAWPDTGKALAADLGAAHAVISNFPGGFPDTPTLSKAMEQNLVEIIKALERSHAQD